MCVKNRYYQHISKLMPGFKLQVPSRSSFKAGKVANGCEGSSADEMDDEEGDVYGEDTSATSVSTCSVMDTEDLQYEHSYIADRFTALC